MLILAEYIHQGFGKQAKRHIYLNCQYDSYEEERIAELENLLELNKIKIPST